MDWKTFKKLQGKGYTPIEYLESSGNQWIDTNYIANANTEIECVVSANDLTSRFGFYGRANGVTDGSIRNFGNGSNLYINHGGSIQQQTNDLQTDVKYTIIHTHSSVTFNGVSYTTDSGTTWVNQNLSILKEGGVSSNDNYFLNGKLYSFKVKENGTLVRDFVPVSKGGVGYMYDLVNDVEYANAGNGSFTLGDRIKWTEFGKVFPYGDRLKSIIAHGEETYKLKVFGHEIILPNYFNIVSLED